MQPSIFHKNLILCFSLLMGGIFSSFAHGGQAFYTFWENEGKLFLTVSVETHDLQHVLAQKQKSQSLGIQSAGYILEHLSCTINGKVILPAFMGSVSQKGWTKLEFELDQCVEHIKTVEVQANGFLRHGHGHGHGFVNTIEFAFPGNERSYTLDSDRRKILARFGEG